MTLEVLRENYHINLPPSQGPGNGFIDHLNYDQWMDQELRQQTGSYYTPEGLAQVMVQMAFIDYFINKDILDYQEAEALFIYQKAPKDPRRVTQVLSDLKIADLACGTGVFLRKTYDLLENTYNSLGCEKSPEKIIHQLYGFDIQDAPVIILKLWFLDKLLAYNQKDLGHNIRRMDSLLDPIDTTFDIVLGNPPYLGEKGNKDLFAPYKSLRGYEGKMDLFYFFIYRGMALLKADGILHFITTNYFITADGAKGLRQYLKENTSFSRLINLDNCKLFKDAKGMHNMIYSLSHKRNLACRVSTITKDKQVGLQSLFKADYRLSQEDLYTETGNLVVYQEAGYSRIIKKILARSLLNLGQVCQVNQGIVSGGDRVTQAMLDKKLDPATIEVFGIEKDDPIFVLTEKKFSDPALKPFYKNSQIRAYTSDLSDHQWILYLTDDRNLQEGEAAYNHLLPFKEVLDKRREVINGKRLWHSLQWYRDPSIFEADKLVVPQRRQINVFSYVEGPFYGSADIYYITGPYLKFLLGYLNSKVVYFWLYTRGKRKGQDLELYAKPLSQIPLPDLTVNHDHLVDLVDDQMVSYKEDRQAEIDAYFYKHFGLSQKDIEDIEAMYPV